MSYHLTVERRANYLHARVVGERTAENMLRFLKEVYLACASGGQVNVLLEMNLSGPSLTTTNIFEIIGERAPDDQPRREREALCQRCRGRGLAVGALMT